MIRNQAGQTISAELINKTNGDDVDTGPTVVYVTIDGGTQTLGTGNIQAKGHGEWTYFPSQAETDGAYLVFTFTNPAAITREEDVYTDLPSTGPVASAAMVGVPATAAGWTFNDFASRVLQMMDVWSPGEDPDMDELNTCLEVFNDMLEAWSIDRLFVWQLPVTTYTLVPGKQVYTIGPGATDFDTVRPVKIERANIIIQADPVRPVRKQMALLTPEQWGSILVQNVPSTFPVKLYDDYAFPISSLHVWPIPTLNYQFELYTFPYTQLSAVVDPAALLVFPPGYRRALRYNLAVELQAEFHVNLDPKTIDLARTTKMEIMARNAPSPIIKPDMAVGGIVKSSWNYITGE